MVVLLAAVILWMFDPVIARSLAHSDRMVRGLWLFNLPTKRWHARHFLP
jgi:hypothetical protein